MFMINEAHTLVIPVIAPVCKCWPFEEHLIWKSRESSIFYVNSGYIHCTNNQYNRSVKSVEIPKELSEGCYCYLSVPIPNGYTVDEYNSRTKSACY